VHICVLSRHPVSYASNRLLTLIASTGKATCVPAPPRGVTRLSRRLPARTANVASFDNRHRPPATQSRTSPKLHLFLSAAIWNIELPLPVLPPSSTALTLSNHYAFSFLLHVLQRRRCLTEQEHSPHSLAKVIRYVAPLAIAT
jgi:hypothetical protein